MKLRAMLFHSRALFGLNGAEPDFIIIGAQKCGTTSLFRYINQSPNFVRSAGKELHYFDRRYDKPFDSYRRQFPKRASGYFTGEASPSYLFFDDVPGRVARHLPDIRIIAILRNPIKRALSQFFHNKRRGRFVRVGDREIKTFEEHVEYNLTTDFSRATPDDRKNFDIVSRGYYQDQIENWFGHFRREQFHFVEFDDLTGNPQGEIDRLMRFLGRPEYQLSSAVQFNSGGDYSRIIAPATLASLNQLYQRKNANLSELVGFPTERWFTSNAAMTNTS